MRINESDEKVLLALKDGPKSLKEIGILVESPRRAKRKTQKLLKYGFVKRIRQGIYGLDSKGKRYIEKLTLSDKALFIGQDLWDKVSAFIIDKVPTEVYQAVVRLTLSEMRAKQSELFTNFKNQFTAGWSGVLLAGKPKAIKTPVGELICMVVGLDPEEHKFSITGTKSEFGVAYQEEGGVWKYRPSPWHKKPIVIIDDWHRIIRKDTRETALSLAHGSRTFKRYGQTFTNHPVPFIAFNTHTKTVSETIEKIIKEIGEEYVKRLVVVNVDYIAPYLEDAAILTRKMLRSIPKLNFKAFPVKKRELSDAEFSLLCEILKEATNPDKREFFDERSVELLVLGRYALVKNRDIIGAIYQTCWDRLVCLETLEVTKDGWRESFRKKWKEYVATEQPKILEEVKKEEKREEERGREIKKTKERAVQQEVEQLKKRRSFEKSRDSLIAKVKDLRDSLPKNKRWENKLFSFRKDIGRLVEEIERIRDPQKLEKYRLIYPELEKEHKKLLEEIKETEDKEKRLKEEQELRQDKFKTEKNIVKEKYETLKKAFKTYAKLTGGMAEDHNQQNERHLESLFSQIEEAKDIDTLTSISSVIEKEIKDVNSWIEEKEAEKERKKREEEGKKENVKKEQELSTKIQAIKKKKKELSEKLAKPLTWRDYDDAEKLEKNQIKTYSNRKKFDKGTISNMFTLAKKYLRKMGFEEKWSYHQKLPFGKQLEWSIFDDWYLASGKTYLLDNINLIDLKEILTGRIKEIDDERKKKLIEQWNALDKQEKSLKPPLYYLRTNRRLVWATNYLGEKENQWLHFEFEDSQKKNVPKGRGWTVRTKIEYGGELFPFISEKGSTILIQANEGKREISKDRIFCYIYEYKGPEPVKEL